MRYGLGMTRLRFISLPFRTAWWLVKTSLKIIFFWVYIPYLLIRRLRQPTEVASHSHAMHGGNSSRNLSIAERESIENDLINTRGISADHKEFIKLKF